jgi:4,5-DOPA dioxygenase extradiol
MHNRLPALFLGHGTPLNAIERNPYSDAWRRLGEALPRPSAILCISAHWYTAGSALTVNTIPRTIHDFGGFPPALHAVQYPAPGSPDLAHRAATLLAPTPARLSESWGLDHGAWSLLVHLYPNADIPVVQLSIDRTRPAEFHYELGRRLAPLRDEGVLILGSGNLIHNLHAYAWGDPSAAALDWAAAFQAHARRLLAAREDASLVHYNRLGREALLAIPSPDHFLPLLYVLGAAPGQVSFPVEGIEGGSLSMLGVLAE